MNREDIIKLAMEAGVIFGHKAEAAAVAPIFERFAALVAEYERNACAKVCDDLADASNLVYTIRAAMRCADAIRARGET